MNQERVSFDESGFHIGGKSLDEEADRKSHHTIQEEVMEPVKIEDIANEESDQYKLTMGIIQGFFVTAGTAGIAILGMLIMSIVLIINHDLSNVGFMFLALPCCSLILSSLEYMFSSHKEAKSPRKRIIAVAVVNKGFYLIEIMLIHQRMTGVLKYNFVYIPFILHIIFFFAYLLTCYCRYLRPGISMYNLITLPVIGVFIDASKHLYANLELDFSPLALPTYFMLFFYGFIIVFLLVQGCSNRDEPFLLEVEKKGKKIQKVTLELKKQKEFQQKVEATGLLYCGLLNLPFFFTLFAFMMGLSYSLPPHHAKSNNLTLKISVFTSAISLVTFIWLCIKSKASITEFIFVFRQFNMLRKRVLLKNKVVTRVSPHFFTSGMQVPSKNKLVDKFIKDISAIDLSTAQVIRDDMTLNGSRIARSEKKRGSLHLTKTTSNAATAHNQLDKSKLDHSVIKNSEMFVKEVRTRIMQRLTQSIIQAPAEADECAVCLDRKMVTVNEPCMHGTFCMQCAKLAFKSEKQSTVIHCPLCRLPIRKILLLSEQDAMTNQLRVVEDLTPAFYEKTLERDRRRKEKLESQMREEEELEDNASYPEVPDPNLELPRRNRIFSEELPIPRQVQLQENYQDSHADEQRRRSMRAQADYLQAPRIFVEPADNVDINDYGRVRSSSFRSQDESITPPADEFILSRNLSHNSQEANENRAPVTETLQIKPKAIGRQ